MPQGHKCDSTETICNDKKKSLPDGPDNKIRWFIDEISENCLMNSFFSKCRNEHDKSTFFVFSLHKIEINKYMKI